MPPKSLLNGAMCFSALAPENRADVLVALDTSEPKLNIHQLSQSVSAATKIDAATLQELFEQFAALTIWDDDESFADAMGEYLAKLAALEADSAKAFAVDAASLIRSKTLTITAKSQTILWGQGLLFVEAKTITQLRPIFLPTVESNASCAVVVHELFITTKQDNETQQPTGILMDLNHLQSLRKVLDRAISKEKALRKNSNLNLLGVSNNDD